jgi:hypothetical protein
VNPALKTRSHRILLSAALALSLGACSKKAEIKSSLSELEKAFPSAPVQAQGATPDAAPPRDDANALVSRAVAAARANDYAGGVIALQAATITIGVTAEQVLAIQDAKQAMVGVLQRRAAAGDQAALAQLKAIEKTRSQ